MKRILLLFLLLLGLAHAEGSHELVDLRATFPPIKPYTQPQSPPVTKKFRVPGPGRLVTYLTESPWYRSTNTLAFRAPDTAWGRLPKASFLSMRFQPERLVEGNTAESWTEYRVSEAISEVEVGLFPAIIRHGDGSFTQLSSSLKIIVEFYPDPTPAAVWNVVETSSGDRWTATWKQRQDGRSFDGEWEHQPGGERGTLTNFCFIRSVNGNRVEIERPGLGCYRGVLSEDRRHIVGTMDWAPGGRWEAHLPAPLP